jgi:rare lipoprotein A
MTLSSLCRHAVVVAALVTPPALLAKPSVSFIPTPHRSDARAEEGWATFYARRRAGRRTASGERYDPAALVAAHPTLPFGTRVRVTRLGTDKSVVVRVIDRGPGNPERRRGFVIDLSRAAAESLDFVRQGRTRVRIDVVDSTDRE